MATEEEKSKQEKERLEKGYDEISSGIEKEAALTKSETPVVELSAHIRKCWDAAKEAKKTVTTDLYKSALQRQGKYTEEKRAKLIKQGEEPVFINITATKCRAAESYFIDVLSTDEPLWNIKPTPIPELPVSRMEYIQQFVINKVRNSEYLMQTKDQTEMAEYIADGLLKAMREDAHKIAERMKMKMEDQLVEAQWKKALREVIPDIITYKAGFLKGPIIRKVKKLQWGDDFTPTQVDSLVIEYERVDPFNIFPSPVSSSVDDGYILEKHKFTRQDLVEMKGVDGYDDVSIMAVINRFGETGLKEWTYSEEEQKEREAKGQKDRPEISGPDDTIDALEFHGSVQGKMLLDWGMSEEEVPDPTEEYPINSILISDYTIKAVINPSITGKKPYYKSSYEIVPGSFWGRGVPELMADIQDICNACVRALVRNMAIASGPQSIIDKALLEPGQDIENMYPFKIWTYDSDASVMGSTGGARKAIEFFQPDPIADVLLAVFDRFEEKSEEVTGIPKYVYGSTDIHGAGRTASGLSMLMGNAAKGIKAVLSAIDFNIIEPSIYELYIHNMMFDPNPLIKGDLKVVARGLDSLVEREATQVRIIEMMGMLSGNEIYLKIVGIEGIAKLLRIVFKTMHIPGENIVPSEDEMKEKAFEIMQQMEAQNQTSSQGQNAKKPMNLDSAGNPARGQDTNLFMTSKQTV